MHTTGLRSGEFELAIDRQPATVEALFAGFDEHDRLGIVLADDHGAVGAATLILATVTAFYDRLRATGEPFLAYPDYFALHLGRDRGSLRKLDVFPDHKQLIVAAEAELILRAINDRGITRLLVPARTPREPRCHPESRASAQRRVRTALAYSPSGRVGGADVHVTGSEHSEAFVTAMLDATAAGDDVRARRAGLRERRRPPRESLRRIGTDDALAMLAAIAEPSPDSVT